ncbi:helix-turn-helix domain-containing protein [Microtetraspora malaysiensis]|uniref:helix-turn-helix domain-containing protein n=1 Tax=Microtetraspora malaysiensis TaxID=161358 RepID=UPI003D94EDE4
MSFSPATRRRELAMALRGYRERARLDSTKVSKQLGWDPSKISRIESGRFRRINVRDVLDMLTLYGVDDPAERERLAQIARDSRAKGWWDQYADVFKSELPNLEAGATIIRTYEILCVPGLLQTPGYAAAMFRGIGVLDDEAVARRVAARMARQEIIVRDNPPQLHAVMDEAALRKSVGGPDVMREQIEHLVKLSDLPNVTIQLIPHSIGAHAAMTMSFTIMCFSAENAPIVYAEMPVSPVVMYKHEDVQSYALLYDRLMATALFPEDTAAAMRSMAAGL